MTSRRLAQIEEQLDAEEAAVKRFTQYVSLAKDPKLREAFQLNRDRHQTQCENLRRELRAN